MTIDPEALKARLAGMQDDFEQAPSDTGSIYDLSGLDGLYEAQIDSFDFFEGGPNNDAFLKIKWQISHPVHGGKVADTTYCLTDPERFRFIKADLATLGIEPDSYQLTDLVPGTEFLGALLDRPAVLKIGPDRKGRIDDYTGKVRVYVYVNAKLDALTPPSDIPLDGFDQVAPTAPAPPGLDDDDIPF